MSLWDKVLPHRFFINRALRTASDELRDHIDSYRKEYEIAVQRCHDEIEAAKAEKDRQFELLKQEYLKELAQDGNTLGELQTLLFEYVDEHIKKQLCYLNKKQLMLELQLLNEYGDFLTEQMKLIGEEITILEQRQESLTLQVKTDDVVDLIRATGTNLSCDYSDNPKTLLEKVNSILFESNDLLPQTRAALFKLRRLLQERAEYLPLIQYISWLIQQKKNLSKDLSKERRKSNEAKRPLKDQLLAIKTELEQLDETMLSKAVCIRNIWAEPLADISVKLAVVTRTLDQQYSRQKYISEEIRTMKSERSSDSDRWERLQVEGKAVYETIGQLKDEKAKMYEQRKQWYERRNAVMGLFKRNNVFLLSPRGEKAPDEVRVLKLRRVEICKKLENVDHDLEARTSQIIGERNQQETVLTEQISAAEQNVSEKKKRLTIAETQLKRLQAQDDRFFIARLFSDTKEVINAKTHRDEAKKELTFAEQKLLELQNELKTIHDSYEQQLSNINRQYEREKSALQANIFNIDSAIEFLQKKKRK